MVLPYKYFGDKQRVHVFLVLLVDRAVLEELEAHFTHEIESP